MIRPFGPRRALTLVESLIALGVTAFLVTLALPALQEARETARASRCRDNLRQLGVALLRYHETAHRFPPGTIWTRFQYDAPRTSYLPHLFPYLGQQSLFDRIDWNVTGTLWCDGNNADVVSVPIPSLLCPSDRVRGASTQQNPYCGEHAVTNYMGFFGDSMADVYTRKAIFGANRGASVYDIADGISNTLIMGEYLTGTSRDLRGALWGDETGCSLIFTELGPNSPHADRLYPNPVLCDPEDPRTNNPSLNLPCVHGNGLTTDTAASRSRHPGGVHVLMADGTVRFINEQIDLATWRGLGAMADGYPLEPL